MAPARTASDVAFEPETALRPRPDLSSTEAPTLAARTRILAPCFALLALALTGCVPAVGGGKDVAEACTKSFVDSIDKLPPELAAHISPAEYEEAARPACAELEAYLEQRDGSEPPTYAEGRRIAADVLERRPDLYRPLCHMAIDAELATLGDAARFVTTKENDRYKTDVCRLAPKYFAPGTTTVDHDRLAADHPELYAPFCAAGMQQALSTDPAAAAIGRRDLAVIARRACTEGYRSGVLTCECTSAQRDQALGRLVDKHAREVLGQG
jgi:hypothetical protein